MTEVACDGDSYAEVGRTIDWKREGGVSAQRVDGVGRAKTPTVALDLDGERSVGWESRSACVAGNVRSILSVNDCYRRDEDQLRNVLLTWI